jgi:hypothetical protein
MKNIPSIFLPIDRMRVFCLAFFIISSGILHAQKEDYFVSSPTNIKSDSVPYSNFFDFKEGIYLSINDFKNNSPISKEQIIIDYPVSEPDFFYQATLRKVIKYKDGAEIEKSVNTNEIWGLCMGRNVYFKNGFYGLSKLLVIGSLCFMAMDSNHSILLQNPIDNSLLMTRADSQSPAISRSPDMFIFDISNSTVHKANAEELQSILEAHDLQLLGEY